MRLGDIFEVLHTYIHTDIHTYRPSDEAGCRGAFAPKKCFLHLSNKTYLAIKSSTPFLICFNF